MDYKTQTMEKLDQISDGEWIIKKNSSFCPNSPCFSGKGLIEIFSVLPGMELSFHYYLVDSISFHLQTNSPMAEIIYCKHGRMDWKTKGGTPFSLRSGDLLICEREGNSDLELSLPLGYYEGISISLDFKQQFSDLPEQLNDITITGKQLVELFCFENRIAIIRKEEKLDSMFSDFDTIPDSIQIPYYKLKIFEILLFLSTIPTKIQTSSCFSQQMELIKKIHAQLVHHFDQRFTIETLSKQYLINASTLKSLFKMVYGMPIATYMKEYRMKKAAQLLRETDDTIAAIAKKVGYESQSKFTIAFKDIFQMLPSEYRKSIRTSNHLNLKE